VVGDFKAVHVDDGGSEDHGHGLLDADCDLLGSPQGTHAVKMDFEFAEK
jgi:hypothetical protein